MGIGWNGFIHLCPRAGTRSEGFAAAVWNRGDFGDARLLWGLLFALFLAGWGFAFLWGPIGDRFGRVRTLMLTILCYSLFTFLGAIATSVWELALFRFLAGLGIGGEWALGGILVAESLPEDRRKYGAGLMHTGYYFGIFLAGALNYWIGTHYGWRAMFALGGMPAILVGFIRWGVREPERWQRKAREVRSLSGPLLTLFAPHLRRRTILNSIYLLISMTGLWAGSVYVPSSITYLASKAGYSAVRGSQLASWGTMLLSAATIAGCLAATPLAERWGRRAALGIYFVIMFFSISIGFGYAFYLPDKALVWFFVALAFLGFGGANFAIYTLWLPEQYPTECRASAFAVATSIGRFVAAGVTFLVGSAVAQYQTIGTPVAWTAAAFLLGLALLPAGFETKGEPLPA